MSDIVVRKLAETIKAPLDVLMRQLQDAGIHVTGPDDLITDQQKVMLLEKIKSNTAHAGTAHLKKTPLSLKRRNEGAASARAGKVNVEVRRKKALPRNENAAVSATSSRTEKLARQMEAERKAREAIIAKAEQERRALEQKRLSSQSEEQSEAPEEVSTTESPVVDDVVSEVVTPEVVAVADEAVTETNATADTNAIAPESEATKPAATEVVETSTDTGLGDLALEKNAEPDKVHSDDGLNQAQDKPAATSDSRSDVSATPLAPKQAGTNPNKEKEAEQQDTMVNLSAREQREAVAAAARKEAAAALKRRPSRPKPTPKVTLAPKAAPAESDDKASATTATPAPTKAAAPADKEDNRGGKRNDKRPARSRGRERDAGGPNIKTKGRKGRKGQQANDVRIERDAKHGFEKPTAPVVREIEIPTTIVVSELAQKLAIRATDIIKAMMKMGMMMTINQSIDQETAILVTEELGHKATPMQEMDDEAVLASVLDDVSNVERLSRPPVVTIMGHVDHGKTSLLDRIRVARVAAGEAGGITQHIGAYHVETDSGTVTFLDTPGHSAFTKMRARGAKITDIVVLIVAADDGVMPQTKEAIDHARAADVPIVVAINKIDKPEADPERVLNELSQYNVLTEAWGGDVPVARVSAKSGEGIDELLETLLLVAEIQELTAAIDVPAKGHVVEASMERGRGAVATVLVNEGMLRKGDIVLCGAEYGRVRAMFDENGRPVKEAGPSIPVAVLGLSGAPMAGDEAVVLTDERKARDIADMRREKQRDTRFAEQQSSKLDNLFNQMGSAEQRAQVNLIIKADVQGSVEALRSELLGLSTDEVEVRVLSSAVGGMTEGDIDLAAASQAIVVAFNVRANAGTRRAAMDHDVEIRYYSVIYDVINDVKDAMSGLLSPETREVFTGLAEVKDVFKASDYGQVAGCLVVEGSVKRGNPIRVLRDNVVIFTGELESLRRHRDDVKEVNVGTECGIAVKDYNDVRVGDQIEVFENVQVARTI